MNDIAVVERETSAAGLPDLGHNGGPPLEMEDRFLMANLPPSLRIFFDPATFDRCKEIARYLARAEGFTPRHLIGKPEACFAVISRSLTWRLDPYAVAQATYQTPGGQVGYFGSLCQAIIESSGRLAPGSGGVHFQPYGDWSKLRGKFRIATSDKGGKYAVATYTMEDEIGLGIKVYATLRGEDEPRSLDFDLVQAFPRNSTLWATDPATQIRYTAVRRFGSSVVPTLFLGVPFDHEGMGDWVDTLQDVTPAGAAAPRPTLAEHAELSAARPRGPGRPRRDGNPPRTRQMPYGFADLNGQLFEFSDAEEAVMSYVALLEKAETAAHAITLWENGTALIEALREREQTQLLDDLDSVHNDIVERLGIAGEEQQQEEHKDPTLPGEEEERKEPDPPPPGEERKEPEPEKQPDPPAAAAPAATAPAATSTAASPGPSATGEAKDDPLFMPITGTIQAWFGPARAKIKELQDAGSPPAVFRRFREVNADAINRLKNELHSWHSILDKAIVAAEGRK